VKDKRGFLIVIPLLLMLLLGAGCLLYEVLLSLVNYKVTSGVFGSPFVGLKNYIHLFSMQQTASQIGNSLLQTLLTVVSGLLIGLPVSLILSTIRCRPFKTAAAGAALLLALVPDLIWVRLGQGVVGLIGTLFGDPQLHIVSYRLMFFASKIIPQSALCIFGGLCLNLTEDQNGAAGALAAGLLPLMTVLMPDLRMNLLTANPINLPVSDTLSYSLYRTGLMTAQYSLAGATAVFGMLVSLLVGLLPALLIGLAASRKANAVKVDLPSITWKKEAMFTLIGSAATGLIVLILCLAGGGLSLNGQVGQALFRTLLTSFVALIPAFLFCLVLLACSGHCRSGIPFGLLALILSLLSVFSMSDYMFTRSLGLLNTLLPCAVGVLGHPAFIAVLLVLLLSRPASSRQLLLTAAGAALIAAAVSAGDWFTPTIYLHSADKATLAMMSRRVSMTAEAGQGDFNAMTAGIFLLFALPGAALTMAGLGGTYLQSIRDPEC